MPLEAHELEPDERQERKIGQTTEPDVGEPAAVDPDHVERHDADRDARLDVEDDERVAARARHRRHRGLDGRGGLDQRIAVGGADHRGVCVVGGRDLAAGTWFALDLVRVRTGRHDDAQLLALAGREPRPRQLDAEDATFARLHQGRLRRRRVDHERLADVLVEHVGDPVGVDVVGIGATTHGRVDHRRGDEGGVGAERGRHCEHHGRRRPDRARHVDLLRFRVGDERRFGICLGEELAEAAARCESVGDDAMTRIPEFVHERRQRLGVEVDG